MHRPVEVDPVGGEAGLSALLPATVRAAECRGDLAEPLFPEEERAISRAVEKRRREFRTVRGCAAAALAALGRPRSPMVPGRRGDSPWPADLVGAMTHCDGYRAAAVARRADVAALGIDAEPHDVLPDGVLGMVAGPSGPTVVSAVAGSGAARKSALLVALAAMVEGAETRR